MKPLLMLLVIFLLAGCSTRTETNAAKAVCNTVANCCMSVQSASATTCPANSSSEEKQPFSVAMHELSKEILTW